MGHFLRTGGSARSLEAMGTFARELVSPTRGSLYDPAINGEAWIMGRTANLGFSTLFDVGANTGRWAEEAYDIYNDASIHCFEIVPSTFEILKERLGERDRLTLNCFGLSNQDTEVTVNVSNDSTVSSMQNFLNSDARKIVAKVIRGDDYAVNANISFVDFLKIDTEGSESLVLQGFESMLYHGKIRLVQFEYNRGAIESHFLLKDFYEFFGKLGYKVGKLTGDGVLFRSYHYSHEDFGGPNYIACRTSDEVLIRAICAR